MGSCRRCESRRNGPTRNPWALDRTPGGSSGGSAAAVAAGMVPIAHGNDGGGSIEDPAACCGLVGLQACAGADQRRAGGGTELPRQRRRADAHGRRHRRGARCAGRLRAGDATWAPRPADSYQRAAARPPAAGSLLIGLALEPALPGATLDPVCEAAARDAAALIESLGHHVEELTPPWGTTACLTTSRAPSARGSR